MSGFVCSYFAFRSLIVQRTSTPVLDAYLPVEKRDARIRTHIMTGFFDEFRKRKVYRVAAAYIVAAGFLIQIASAAFPAWDLPSWSLRLVIVLLLIGFPMVATSRMGLQSHYCRGNSGHTANARNSSTPQSYCARCALGVIVSAAAGLLLLPRAVSQKIDKSIAVLPFKNLSSDKANAYFADGIQDEILTRLAKIGELKVISRTSTQQYQQAGEDPWGNREAAWGGSRSRAACRRRAIKCGSMCS